MPESIYRDEAKHVVMCVVGWSLFLTMTHTVESWPTIMMLPLLLMSISGISRLISLLSGLAAVILSKRSRRGS